MNENKKLGRELLPAEWVKENTAVLVVHGIGDQFPYATLDDFGRGIIKEYRRNFPEQISLEHVILKKEEGGRQWFDNAVRLNKKDSPHHIDLYEYYWADYTEDKISITEINTWLQGVVDGAEEFYRKNAAIVKAYEKHSVFFKDGKFQSGKYKSFLAVASRSILIVNSIVTGLLKLISRIPFIGGPASGWLRSFLDSRVHRITNVIGDIVIYNVVDPKCKFFRIKREIHEGAVKALRYLVEKQEGEHCAYPSVLVAGHSLGSQVAYDAINKINILASQQQLSHYNAQGLSALSGRKLSEQLRGFITFGSPLDKIAFFLREKVKDEFYLRQQLINNYHSFRICDLNLAEKSPEFLPLPPPIPRMLEEIPWRNYYDAKDQVSGSLDYYRSVVNLDCEFGGDSKFTHSDYWTHPWFYNDVVLHLLSTPERPPHDPPQTAV